MGILATPTTLSPGELAVTTNIRVVSISIAAYEYVPLASCSTSSHRSSNIWLVISSPYLGNIDCIGPPPGGGKKVDTSSQSQDLHNTFDRLGLILFILIRHVFQYGLLRHLLTGSVDI
jgi:hypothetical protein